MINNSTPGKWDRLKQKNIDTQFVNTVIGGLNCSPFEAEALLDTVYAIYKPFFDTSGTLKPGQLLVHVVALEEPPGKPLKECKLVLATITLDAGDHDLETRKKEGVSGLRQKRMVRISNEVFQQGGLLTVEDLAHKIFNCGQRTICRDIKTLKEHGIILPLRSTIKDMGRTLSHRVEIVKQWLSGKEYFEIGRITNHSVEAVSNYVNKFKRVVCLLAQNYEEHSIGFLVKLSPSLAAEYATIYKNHPAVAHRERELKELLKKTMSNS